MYIIQITGKTGSGKSTLGRLVGVISGVNDMFIQYGLTRVAIKLLSGSVVLDNVPRDPDLTEYLANKKITHLYIISEEYIENL